MTQNNFNIEIAYGHQDLAETELFHGGFINFGYWEKININKNIPISHRIKSSENLYRELFKRLQLKNKDRILEVGCGRGYGAVLMANKFPNAQIVGMDLLDFQLNKACQIHQKVLSNNPRLVFLEGDASSIPFTNNYFSKVISVEAAQHFESIEKFIFDTHRVLKQGGKISFTTFFSSRDRIDKSLLQLFPYVAHGVDKLIPISYVIKKMKEIGFINVVHESIGKHVWYGFDKWLEQTDHHDQWGRWGRNWLKAFHDGHIDYYIITGNKS